MQTTAPVLVCFAVPEEARHFRKQIPFHPPCETVITGIGHGNARSVFSRALRNPTPRLVLSSGFAGGLNPGLEPEAVVFEAPNDFPLSPALLEAGACPGRFHCAERIAATAAEKRQLREHTAADAVEMESGIIRTICFEAGIPCGTVRVISDAAHEDLPLDFNRLMTPGLTLDYFKLAGALANAPLKAIELWRFRRRIDRCARKLAKVLCQAIENAVWDA